MLNKFKNVYLNLINSYFHITMKKCMWKLLKLHFKDKDYITKLKMSYHKTNNIDCSSHVVGFDSSSVCIKNTMLNVWKTKSFICQRKKNIF